MMMLKRRKWEEKEKKDEARENDKCFLVIKDRKTHWCQSYACKSKSTEQVCKCFGRFLGPGTKAQYAYTDNSQEFKKAFEDMGITHDTSTPYRPEANGVAERAVRRVKEGTSCTLHQSGFSDDWWGHAMQCFCFMHVLQIYLVRATTQHQESIFFSF